MRLELDENNNVIEPNVVPEMMSSTDASNGEGNVSGSKNSNSADDDFLKAEKKERRRQEREKFKELSFNGKLGYIFDYYKWFFVAALVLIIGGTAFIRDYKENLKPIYLQVEMINSYFAYDNTNTLVDDYVSQYNIDTEANHLYIEMDLNLSEEAFDSYMLANQQKIVAMYAAGDIDVVIGPVETMEGSANCDGYANLMEILPQDLIEELEEREYEFYTYDAAKVAAEHAYDDDLDEATEYREPYIAGIYLDNCAYLNNQGEYGAYPVATSEKDRPIFTIPVNSPHPDHAFEFLRFLIENR